MANLSAVDSCLLDINSALKRFAKTISLPNQFRLVIITPVAEFTIFLINYYALGYIYARLTAAVAAFERFHVFKASFVGQPSAGSFNGGGMSSTFVTQW